MMNLLNVFLSGVFVNFYNEHTTLFWVIVGIIVFLGFSFLNAYFTTVEEANERLEYIRHERKKNAEIRNQWPNILNWKGKKINILSSTIGENCLIQEIIRHRDKLKIVLEGRPEFVVIELPYKSHGSVIQSTGSVIKPTDQPKKLNSAKEFFKSPLGLGAGTVVVATTVPILAAPVALAWIWMNSFYPQQIIQFSFVE